MDGWFVQSSPRPIAAGSRRKARAVLACAVPSNFLFLGRRWASIESSLAERENSAGIAHEKICPRVGGRFGVRAGNSIGAEPWWRCSLGCDIGGCGVRSGGRGCGRAGWIYRWTGDLSFPGSERGRIKESRSDEIPRRGISRSPEPGKPRQPGSARDDGKCAASRNTGDVSTTCSLAIRRKIRRNDATRSGP